MSYLFTPTGWYARFDPKQSSGGIVQKPVEAWSPDGDALVVDAESGALKPVHSLQGFVQLAPCRRIASIVPAEPGWRLHDITDGTPYTAPVVGWVIDDAGDGLAVCVGDEGPYYQEFDHQVHRILPPGAPQPESSTVTSE